MDVRELGVGEREAGIDLDRLLEQFPRPPVVHLGAMTEHDIFGGPQVVLIGYDILCRFRLDDILLSTRKGHVELQGDLLRDPRLDVEYRLEILIIALRPDMAVVRDPYQLRCHAHPAAAVLDLFPPHRPLEHIIDIQLGADLRDRLVGILVMESTLAGYHAELVYGG